MRISDTTRIATVKDQHLPFGQGAMLFAYGLKSYSAREHNLTDPGGGSNRRWLVDVLRSGGCASFGS